MKKSLGERIKSIRLEKGYTMEDFGKLFNTSKGTVNNWEKGRNNPNRENLKKIAELGDVSVDYLLTGNKDLKNLTQSDINNLWFELQPAYKESLSEIETIRQNLLIELKNTDFTKLDEQQLNVLIKAINQINSNENADTLYLVSDFLDLINNPNQKDFNIKVDKLKENLLNELNN